MSGRRRPIERVVDAAIAVPVSIFAATRQLIPIATTRVEQAIGRRVSTLDRRRRRAVPERPHRERPRPAAAAGDRGVASLDDARPEAPAAAPVAAGDQAAVPAVEDLAIDAYDHLSARQIVDRLADLAPHELESVADYERSNRRRQTVLTRIAQLT